MFTRGRIDHFALLAPSEEAFRELRRRIEAEGAADGDVRDMNSFWIMGCSRTAATSFRPSSGHNA